MMPSKGLPIEGIRICPTEAELNSVQILDEGF